jgi:hypothetical protein
MIMIVSVCFDVDKNMVKCHKMSYFMLKEYSYLVIKHKLKQVCMEVEVCHNDKGGVTN